MPRKSWFSNNESTHEWALLSGNDIDANTWTTRTRQDYIAWHNMQEEAPLPAMSEAGSTWSGQTEVDNILAEFGSEPSLAGSSIYGKPGEPSEWGSAQDLPEVGQ